MWNIEKLDEIEARKRDWETEGDEEIEQANDANWFLLENRVS